MSDKQENLTPAEEESTLFTAPRTVETKKRPKKRVVTLLITLAVLLVLGGAVVAAYFGGVFDETETSEVSEETSEVQLPSLADYSATGISAIEKITVTNDTGSFSLVPNGDGAMTVEGFGDLPRDAEAVETLLVQYTAVTPDLVIAEEATAEQLAACGLDKPSITVTTHYTDKKTLTVVYGRLASGADAGYYGMEKGGKTVWLFREDYYQAAMHEATYYLGKTLISAPSPKSDDNVGTAKLKSLTLTGGNRDEAVQLRYITPKDDDSVKLCGKYVLEKPYSRPADNDVVGSWDSSLCGLYGATVEAVHPTAAELASFGLDTPRTIATLTFGIYAATDENGKNLDEPLWYNEITYTVSLGNRTDDDTYYAMVDGVDVVYTVNAATVPWATSTYESLVNKSLFLRYITTLSGINTTVDGEPYTFRMTHGTTQDESGSETSTLSATVNGKKAEEGNIRALYESMMTVKRIDTAPADAEKTNVPVLTLALVPKDGGVAHSFAFYPYSANRFWCLADDGDRFLVKAADVEGLATQIHTLATLSVQNENASKKATKETSKKNNP